MDNRIHSFRPSSELQIEERRRKVQQAKERSICRSCGQTSHWAGDDKALPKGKKGKGFRRSEVRQAPQEINGNVRSNFSSHAGVQAQNRCRSRHVKNLTSCSFQTRAKHGKITSLSSQARVGHQGSIPFEARPWMSTEIEDVES